MSKKPLLNGKLLSAFLLTAASIAVAMQLPAIGAPQKSTKAPILRLPIRPISPTSYQIPLPAGHGKVLKNAHVQYGLEAPPAPGEVEDNSILIMPNKGDTDNAMQKLREVNGTVSRVLGSGDSTTWVVKFETPSAFIKAEKQLIKDKHFKNVQRNYIFSPQTNDQYFPAQQTIYSPTFLNVVNGWNRSPGEQRNVIAIIDTGVSLKNIDLVGKCYPGYDCRKGREQQKDTAGHGTMVSTTAAAIGDNYLLTAGPARNSAIFPINAYVKKGFPTDTLVEAMDQCMARGIKIANMSLNARAPEYSLSNKNYNAVLHDRFKTYHDNGGLLFNAAGNEADNDTNPRWPYLIVVSATDTSSGQLASFSTYGNSVWFTAPGVYIPCSTKQKEGKIVAVSGTSFSSPLAASIAALIWGAKPSLTNLQVEQIMINTANRKHDPNFSGGYVAPNQVYGYGMPDAGAALKFLFP